MGWGGRTNTFITDVKVLRKGTDMLPEGYEFVDKTVGGAWACGTKRRPPVHLHSVSTCAHANVDVTVAVLEPASFN